MSIGWPDLGGTLLWIVGTLLVVGAVIGVLVWDARRRRSTSAMVDVTAAVARVWLALIIVSTVLIVLKWFTAGFTEVPALPVSLPWPTALPCEGGPGVAATTQPTLECASAPTVEATLTSLTAGTRVVLGAGELLALLLLALPGVVVAVICRATLKGRPFNAVTSRWLLIAAVVILVAGLGSDVLTGIGSAMAAAEVLPPPGAGAVTTTGIYRVALPLWPIGAALALAALGVVFRHGARLQRETDLLV